MRLVSISENLGHDVTFSLLNATTNNVISRSNVMPTGEHASPNFIIFPLTAPEVVKSRHLPSDYIKDNEEAHADVKK